MSFQFWKFRSESFWVYSKFANSSDRSVKNIDSWKVLYDLYLIVMCVFLLTCVFKCAASNTNYIMIPDTYRY